MPKRPDEPDAVPEWQFLDLPASPSATWPGAPLVRQRIHHLDFGEEWKVYVYEHLPLDGAGAAAVPPVPPGLNLPGVVPLVPTVPAVSWLVVYRGREVASGEVKTVETGKKLAVRCLMAFQDVDPELPEAASPPLAGRGPGPGATGRH